MISIIVISNREELFERLCLNINKTATGPFEIINEKQVEKGICFAYNEGAKKARYNNLCFVHDDVLFHTTGWDQKVIAHLPDRTTGMIGSMGGRYKSYFGAGWNDGSVMMHRYNIKNGAHGGISLFHNPENAIKSQVVCLDGAFLCCTKQTWQSNQFDDKTFQGFHFYDIDICLQTHKNGLRNYVVYDITIEHFSDGNKDAAFLNDYFLFAQRWKDDLPVHLDSLSKKELSNFDGYALTETIQLIKKNKISNKYALRLVKQYYSLYKNFYQLVRFAYYMIFK